MRRWTAVVGLGLAGLLLVPCQGQDPRIGEALAKIEEQAERLKLIGGLNITLLGLTQENGLGQPRWIAGTNFIGINGRFILNAAPPREIKLTLEEVARLNPLWPTSEILRTTAQRLSRPLWYIGGGALFLWIFPVVHIETGLLFPLNPGGEGIRGFIDIGLSYPFLITGGLLILFP